MVDLKSGKEVEPQPSASDPDEWEDYLTSPIEEEGAFDVQEVRHNTVDDVSTSVINLQEHSSDNDIQNSERFPPILPRFIQEAAVLQTRGFDLSIVRHRQTRDLCVLYGALSGRSFRLSAGSDLKILETFVHIDSREVKLDIKSDFANLRELLAIIDHYDVILTEEGANGL